MAALLLMGLNAAVPAGFLASKPREELLKNVKDLQSAPAIIVPCGVGVDPLTSGLTVQYHPPRVWSGHQCNRCGFFQ